MNRFLLAAAVAVTLAGCRRSAPDTVAATVNSKSISYAELDKQVFSQFSTQPERSSDDQATIQKLEVLRSLIDSEIMLQRAERQSLMAPDSEVDAKFNELKAPYTQEEFQRQLTARKMTIEDLKAQLRRDLSIQRLFNKEITSQISISEKDIADFYNTNKASFNLAEPQVHMSQILVTPGVDNVRNLKSDDAQDEASAKRKIEGIAQRLRAGEDFAALAQNYSEDPQSSQNGGDMGYIPESSLEKANAELRKAVMAMQPGQITPILHTSEGYRILKIISKEPAGQRELTDPKVQQTIRETLINRKDQLLKAAYYEVARNEAQVKNYFAVKVFSAPTKK